MLFNSLNAAAGTGAGTSQFSGAIPLTKIGFQVSHTGNPIAVIVTAEGSLDGTNYFIINTWSKVSLSSGDIIFSTDKPTNYIRANLTTLTGGTSPTVTATISAI